MLTFAAGMKRLTLFIISLCLMLTIPARAQHKWVERSTDALCLLPSATGAVVALVEKDYKGLLQLGLSSATALAINYGLEAAIRKDRPDGTGHHAFPSTHTAVAFNGSSFLLRRYGWKWGVPAYTVSSFVAWGRVYAKRHDWWDVLGGAAIGAGAAFIYTRPFARNMDITIAPVSFGDDGGGVDVAITF